VKAYKVTDRDGDPYFTCWVVAETAQQAKRIARERSASDKLGGWDLSDMRAERAPEFEDGEDLTTAHFIDDVDTGLEPHYGYQYSY
jgi:hypothetical protein